MNTDIGDFVKCPVCKEWGWSRMHRCAPVYAVRLEDWDTCDERSVHANSPEEAAEKFVENNFADFDFPTSETVVVNDAGHLYKYLIEVEPQPVFSATLLEEKKAEEECDGEEVEE